jgi:hypothetical protein
MDNFQTSIETSFHTSILTSRSATPSQPELRKFGNQLYVSVEQLYKKRRTRSWVWGHGTEMRLDPGTKDRFWACGYCERRPFKSTGLFYVEEHLVSHSIYRPDADQSETATTTEKGELSLKIKSQFDEALVEWIV